MRPIPGPAILSVIVLVAACGGGVPTTAPAPTTPSGSPAPATGGTGTAPCSDPGEDVATVVETSVGDFTFATVSAKVGDVVTWTNGDSVAHGVELDDGSCAMDENIAANGGRRSLVFNVAGTFPFHCTVHPGTMKGTITIT